MISIIAGVRHLKDISAFYKTDNENQENSPEDDLRILESKLAKIYDIIKSDPNYAKINYRDTINVIQTIMNGRGLYEGF
jgi:hypothetical protein